MFHRIDVPIFSSLYRDIAGADPTLFNALSLIVAIPMTIITKIITGAAPPAVETKFNPQVVDFLFNYNSARLLQGFTGAPQSTQQVNGVQSRSKYIFPCCID